MLRREAELVTDGHFISALDGEKWDQALSSVGRPDSYFTAAYHRLSEIDSGRRAYAYFYQVQGQSLFHPFLIAPVPWGLSDGKILYDIESCYGYSGPLSTTNDPVALSRLWEPYLNWCQTQGIVVEVTKCHPLLKTEQFVNKRTRILRNREMVLIDVSKPEDILWTNYPPSQRTTIRQALKNGLISRLGAPGELKSVFLPIYESAMNFVSATSRYYFSGAYFDFLAGIPESFFDLLVIERESLPIAAALFFKGSEFYHYHLSGSLPEFRDFRPNNLLLHEASLRAHRLGLTKFHLGGGRTSGPDDALFKFKASFSDLRAEFHIGETIHQPEAYEQISQNWLRQAAQTERPVPLLFYRTPLPSSS